MLDQLRQIPSRVVQTSFDLVVSFLCLVPPKRYSMLPSFSFFSVVRVGFELLTSSLVSAVLGTLRR